MYCNLYLYYDIFIAEKLVVHTNELEFVYIYTLKQLILKKLLVIYKKVEFDMRIYKNINDKK